MKTSITNRIRSVIDALPRSIRDARWFMWPFFVVWFRGRHVTTAMELKRLAPSMTDAEFRDVYRQVKTLADHRVTDTNAEAMEYVLSKLLGESLLDVGSGRGYFLSKVGGMWRVGCDLGGPGFGIRDPGSVAQAQQLGSLIPDPGPRFVASLAEHLPFKTNAFDTVTCFHTLEHVRDLGTAIAELKRVARRRLIVIVPRQRRFHYTLDLHLQFFETADALRDAMGAPGEIRQFGSDLVYISAP